MAVQFGSKDVIGPLVSSLAALLSLFCFWLNFRLSRRMADRSLYLEAQKLLLEVNRQLIADPWLWSIYDDHAVRSDPDFESKCTACGLFQAKLQAFAYLKLNMFEVILAEVPKPGWRRSRRASKVWLDYFHHTLAKSSVVRGLLESPDTARLYNPVLIARYKDWKKSVAPAKPAAS